MCSIYTERGQCLEVCRSIQHAASHIASLGAGATIRISGRIVWTEGIDGRAYAFSYEAVERVIKSRLTQPPPVA